MPIEASKARKASKGKQGEHSETKHVEQATQAMQAKHAKTTKQSMRRKQRKQSKHSKAKPSQSKHDTLKQVTIPNSDWSIRATSCFDMCVSESPGASGKSCVKPQNGLKPLSLTQSHS